MLQVVLDLGCGPSVLGIAATLMGAATVVRHSPQLPQATHSASAAHTSCPLSQTGFDVDEDALEIAVENVSGFEDMHEEFIRGSVAQLPLRQARPRLPPLTYAPPRPFAFVRISVPARQHRHRGL